MNSLRSPSACSRAHRTEPDNPPAFNTMPGITQALFGFTGVHAAAQAARNGSKKNDLEGVLENSVRVVQNCAAIANAFLQIGGHISAKVSKICQAISPLAQQLLMLGTVITGLVVALIEAALEARGIFRTTRFTVTLQHDATNTRDILQALRQLKRNYLELSPQEIADIQALADKKWGRSTDHHKEQFLKMCQNNYLEGKYNQLTRCVQAPFAHHLIDTLDSLITDLENNRPGAVSAAKTCLNQALIQAEKSRLMHFIGLASSLFVIGALIAAHFAVPVLPIFYFVIAIAFACVRYGLYVEGFSSFDWKFSWKGFLQKGFIIPVKTTAQQTYEKMTTLGNAAYALLDTVYATLSHTCVMKMPTKKKKKVEECSTVFQRARTASC